VQAGANEGRCAGENERVRVRIALVAYEGTLTIRKGRIRRGDGGTLTYKFTQRGGGTGGHLCKKTLNKAGGRGDACIRIGSIRERWNELI